ncbi:quinolinate synthase [Marchantia polymorpha subsp. ruderalis]|uniref:Quinolinate synthase, chloroplastic n=2 Tax=Marchantia polymorpha TaxID=3197 RepID=A0AAF6C127_MARPO|nr:hypothetical protein MARPO_0102s0006 [Marchantia polymorpha]BBN17961.1 hypothetical protein Mp_7g18340 [Marchantia polymorpha subsp. ruderalis]|eukprot:PTQ32129.1 hypothetical protein MARPO_0102s0006 [Marchantia polymorpha]
MAGFSAGIAAERACAASICSATPIVPAGLRSAGSQCADRISFRPSRGTLRSAKHELSHKRGGVFGRPSAKQTLRASAASARGPRGGLEEAVKVGVSDSSSVGGERGWSELGRVIQEVAGAGSSSPRQSLEKLMNYASQLAPLPASERVTENRVPGCTSRVWLTVDLQENGEVHFAADSDAEIVRGTLGLLLQSLNGTDSQEILSLNEDGIAKMLVSVPKSTTWYTICIHMQKRVRALLERRSPGKKFDPFPSLIITAEDIQAQGSFAEAQVQYLTPDPERVKELVEVLRAKNIGVVAHFYMDPEVQGVLVAAKKEWPHIHISDSLVMAEHAVKMAEVGCKAVAVLGVDFMSENVRAILDKNGLTHVPVYRMSSDEIGCSLAEAAESAEYLEYLKAASVTPKSLHVIYINTSLETKAQAQSLVPTITCTSSNVLQTILQAFAQVPDLTLWYGPDSYMGANLAEMLVQLMSMTDEEIAKVHPAHNRKTISTVLSHLQYYQNGACIVHDLFGKEVVNKLRDEYSDAYQTAHLEVPGEMFTLAMEARARGRGAVGSTQNILDFITIKVREILDSGVDACPKFVLGTEAGMITAIVEAVRQLLIEHKRAKGFSAAKVGVEIVFPVSTDAVAPLSTASSSPSFAAAGLNIVPGVVSGEGCSVNGGCASCVYMKMNRLDRLLRICKLVGTSGESLLAEYEPRTLKSLSGGENIAELGCEPILSMRYFQSNKRLSDQLVEDINRHACASVPK